MAHVPGQTWPQTSSRVPRVPLELPAGFDVDVSSPGSIARLASLAKDHLGGVDVWVNNAGYSGSFQVLAHFGTRQ